MTDASGKPVSAARSSVPVEVHGGGRFVAPARSFVPAYLRAHDAGRLIEKVDEAIEALRRCALCPRDCRVDRLGGRRVGVCKVARHARVSAAFAHRGEEDVLRGRSGSGTIFFSFCNLRCQFCQNWQTSQTGEGEDVSPRELAAMMVGLQAEGCHNINLVTPEHVVPQILEALPHAIDAGLRLPIVCNTSAYDGLDSLRLTEGVTDIYMPDFKLWDRERCRRYLLAPDYAEVARRAIRAMHAQVGDLVVDEDGFAVRGLLVRHLVMPGMLDDTREILRWLAALSPDTYVNVMDQYAPAWKARRTSPEIDRHVDEREIAQALAAARDAGLWRLDRRWLTLADRVFSTRWL